MDIVLVFQVESTDRHRSDGVAAYREAGLSAGVIVGILVRNQLRGVNRKRRSRIPRLPLGVRRTRSTTKRKTRKLRVNQ